VVLHGEVEGWRLADATDLDGILLREAVRGRDVGRVRHAVEELLPCLLGSRELPLEAAQIHLHLLELLELLGRRLALELRPTA
jgi:hypothetical protein